MLEEDEEVLRRRAKKCEDKKESIGYFALYFLSIDRLISEVSGTVTKYGW